jgi:hypothetical protein
MLAHGSSVGGRYRLDSLIGEGGMASVWRAEDETLRRPVAIKLLYFGSQRDPAATAQQFLREARIAASVQHRNVIHIVDFGATDDGVPYMVMELLHGESLGERMQRTPGLAPEEVLGLAGLTLRGLAAVHDAGIVHRDLKPQNIFLQQDGDAIYPKIIDFGISRSLASTGERRSAVATQAGLVVGTPGYMAPEQARGEAEIDRRADIYSMGAIIYEGVTGRLPFEGATPGELLIKIISSEPPLIRDIAPHVPLVISDVIAQAMARQREHRFVDARAFRRALQSAADQAFPLRAGSRTSEVPVRTSEVGAPAGAASQALVFESESPPAPLPMAAEVRPPQAWGDFEGIGARAVSGPLGARERGVIAASQPRAAGERPATVPLQPRAAGERAATVPLQPRAAGERAATVPLQPKAAGERPATVPLQPSAAGERAATGPLQPRAAGERPATVPLQPSAAGEGAATGPLQPRAAGARAATVPLQSRAAGERAATGPLQPSAAGERAASAPLQPRPSLDRSATAARMTPDRALTAPLTGRHAAERAGSMPQPRSAAGPAAQAGSGLLAGVGAGPRARHTVPERAPTAGIGIAARDRAGSAGQLAYGALAADPFEELTDPSPAPGLEEPYGSAHDDSPPLELAPRPEPGGRGSNDFEAYGQEGPLLGDNPLDVFGSTEALPLDLEVQPQAANSNARGSRPPPAGLSNKRRESRVGAAVEDRPRARRKSVSKFVWVVPGLLLLVLTAVLLAPSLVSAPAPDDAAAQTREAQNPATRRSQRRLGSARPSSATKLSPAQRELMN